MKKVFIVKEQVRARTNYFKLDKFKYRKDTCRPVKYYRRGNYWDVGGAADIVIPRVLSSIFLVSHLHKTATAVCPLKTTSTTTYITLYAPYTFTLSSTQN